MVRLGYVCVVVMVVGVGGYVCLVLLDLGGWSVRNASIARVKI